MQNGPSLRHLYLPKVNLREFFPHVSPGGLKVDSLEMTQTDDSYEHSHAICN